MEFVIVTNKNLFYKLIVFYIIKNQYYKLWLFQVNTLFFFSLFFLHYEYLKIIGIVCFKLSLENFQSIILIKLLLPKGFRNLKDVLLFILFYFINLSSF